MQIVATHDDVATMLLRKLEVLDLEADLYGFRLVVDEGTIYIISGDTEYRSKFLGRRF